MSGIREYLEGGSRIDDVLVEQEGTFFEQPFDDVRDRLESIVQQYPRLARFAVMSWRGYMEDEPIEPDFSREIDIKFETDVQRELRVKIKGGSNYDWEPGEPINIRLDLDFHMTGMNMDTVNWADETITVNDPGRSGFEKVFDGLEDLVDDVIE